MTFRTSFVPQNAVDRTRRNRSNGAYTIFVLRHRHSIYLNLAWFTRFHSKVGPPREKKKKKLGFNSSLTELARLFAIDNESTEFFTIQLSSKSLRYTAVVYLMNNFLISVRRNGVLLCFFVSIWSSHLLICGV